MHTIVRREDGAAAMELGIVLPLLLVLMAFVAPLVKFGYDYMVIQRAAAHGVRFASRADVNVRYAEDGVTLTRRPTPSEVAKFVGDSSDGMIDPGQVAVFPNPSSALPGERIEVTVDHTISYGPLAEIANEIKKTFFGGSAFPTESPVKVSAWGREE